MAPRGARRAHLRGPAGRHPGDLTVTAPEPSDPGPPSDAPAAGPAPPRDAAAAGAVVLFDLDGVLADSRVAITSCMNHALAAAGREPVPPASLYPLIGPSLSFGFASLLGVDPDSPEVVDCIASYRSVYAEVSLRDTPTYPGVPEALATIGDGGGSPPRRLAVATSKPRAFAEPLIGALGFAHAFEAIFAPELDLHVESKTTTVGRALATLGASAGTMVGDRHVDMEAAHAHGLRAVGVTWGFGTPEELRTAGADVLVSSPADLPAAIT